MAARAQEGLALHQQDSCVRRLGRCQRPDVPVQLISLSYVRPVGEWNFQEVTVKGSRIKVELNGTVILDTDLSKVTEFMANSPHPGKDRTSGYFGFLGHNDPVEFRNVRIKTLK